MLTPTTLRIAFTVINGVAQILTAVRLAFRSRRRRFWLDDCFAACATITSLLLLISFWMITDVEGVGPLKQSHTARVRAYWVFSVAHLWTIWSARISLLLSSVRLTPPSRMRSMAFLVAGFLGMMWASLFAQRVYLCVHHKDWEALDVPTCSERTIVITESAFEIASDLLLVVMPMVLMYHLRGSSMEQRLFRSIALGCILVMGASLARVVFLIRPSVLITHLTEGTEAAVSLLATNIAAFVVFIHRHTVPEEEVDDPKHAAFPSSSRVMGNANLSKEKISMPNKLDSLYLGPFGFGHLDEWLPKDSLESSDSKDSKRQSDDGSTGGVTRALSAMFSASPVSPNVRSSNTSSTKDLSSESSQYADHIDLSYRDSAATNPSDRPSLTWRESSQSFLKYSILNRAKKNGSPPSAFSAPSPPPATQSKTVRFVSPLMTAADVPSISTRESTQSVYSTESYYSTDDPPSQSMTFDLPAVREEEVSTPSVDGSSSSPRRFRNF